jgi:hypothetical protein
VNPTRRVFPQGQLRSIAIEQAQALTRIGQTDACTEVPAKAARIADVDLKLLRAPAYSHFKFATRGQLTYSMLDCIFNQTLQ